MKRPWNDGEDRRGRRYAIPRYGNAWLTDFPHPLRLEQYRYGLNVAVTASGLAAAQAEYTRAQMLDIAASGIDHVRYMFYVEEVTGDGKDPALLADARACFRFVVRTFLAHGINVILQVGSDGTVRRDLHGETSGWTQAEYNAFLQNLYAVVSEVPGVTPETLMIGIGNEMALDVTPDLWSMDWYNGFVASAVAAVREVAPDTTVVYCLYPLGAPNHYTYGGTDLAKPADKNTLADVHFYHPGQFSLFQGMGEGLTGQEWITFPQWPMSVAEVGSWLQTWTAGGAYGTIPAATAQINYWRANYASLLPAAGLTDAEVDSGISGLIGWCRSNQVALHCGEFGGDFLNTANMTAPAAAAGPYLKKVTSMLNGYGVGHCLWMYPFIANGSPGSRVLDSVKVTWDAARRTITNGIRSL
jgi:hypothetical protein